MTTASLDVLGTEYVVLFGARRHKDRPVAVGTPRDLPQQLLKTEHVTSPSELRDIVENDEVEYVAPAMPMRLIDPFEAAESMPTTAWGLEYIGVTGEDPTPYDGEGTKIAVLDTGINQGHCAFKGISEWTVKNFTNSGAKSDVSDENGHGTHCAGTIFGRDVNDCRIGVAPAVTEVIIAKVIGPKGGSTIQVCDAINWAIGEKANVISMSLGFDMLQLIETLENRLDSKRSAYSLALNVYLKNVRLFDAISAQIKLRDAVEEGMGAIVLAATGNESQHPNVRVSASFPAAAQDFLSVGAVNRTDTGLDTAHFSNLNPDVVAPGVSIISASHKSKDALRSLSGTSMATPHIAGLIALHRQALTQLSGKPPTAKTAIDELLNSATPIGHLNSEQTGKGLPHAPR